MIDFRFLAGGPFFERYSANNYRISQASSSKIVYETCRIIYEELSKTEFMEYTEDNWLTVADGFLEKWNMPNCVGAIDGKHIKIMRPSNAGSLYFNYKVIIKMKLFANMYGVSVSHTLFVFIFSQRYHSIILMAACDADYRFTFIDVGSPGSDGDVNVFSRSTLGSGILTGGNSLNFPPDCIVDDQEMPFFLIGDDAFPLTSRIMKPFPGHALSNEQKVFNYRLSRARRTIENSFGILVKRWACLQTDFVCHVGKAKVIASACCALHNFLLNRRCSAYMNQDRADRDQNPDMPDESEWADAARSLDGMTSYRGRPRERANNIRDRLRDYFYNVFTLPWQFERAHCTE